MLIRMTKTTPASRDGLTVEDFAAEREYTMTTAHEVRVAKSLIASGWATEVPSGATVVIPGATPRIESIGGAQGEGQAVPTVFDPTTAPIEAVRAFLAERNAKYHHKTGEAKLREMALEIVTGEG